MIDVAVAGGGPAGSAAAALLARDFDVAVLEEHPRVGEPVRCAGLISEEAVRLSGVSPDLLAEFTGVELVFPDGTAVRARSDSPMACAVDRAQFDSLLADRALSAGAEYRLSDRVRSFSVSDGRVSVESSRGSLDARLLVGADGPSSAVARGMGAPEPSRVNGVQAEVSARYEEQDVFRIRVGSRYAPRFFAWEVPCGDVTRVGLCVYPDAGSPWGYLQRLLSDLGLEGRVTSKAYGRIPMGPVGPMSSDRVMLIGDAASQVKPVSAGGIYPSMASAPILADVARAALEADDLSAGRLREYDRRWSSEVGPEIARGARLRRAYERLDDGDLNVAGRYAAREDVRDSLNRVDIDAPSGVIRDLLRKPRAGLAGLWTLLRCMV